MKGKEGCLSLFGWAAVLLAQFHAARCIAPADERPAPQPSPAASVAAARATPPAWALPADLTPHTTEHYVIAVADDRNWARDTGGLLENFRTRFIRTFTERGFALAQAPGRLAWVCFQNHDAYRAYARDEDRVDAAGMPAYYSCRTNRVALLLRPQSVGPGVAVQTADSSSLPLAGAAQAPWVARPGAEAVDPARIRHEAAHQLAYNVGLMRRTVMYPLWVAEGLATSFEPPEAKDGGMIADNAPRRRDLMKGIDRGRLEPLDDFVAMSELPGGDPADNAALYAQAWAFWQFMLANHPRQLRGYLATLSRAPMGLRRPRTLRIEFVQAFGPVEPVEQSWRNHLKRLRLTSADAPHAADAPTAQAQRSGA